MPENMLASRKSLITTIFKHNSLVVHSPRFTYFYIRPVGCKVSSSGIKKSLGAFVFGKNVRARSSEHLERMASTFFATFR